MPKFTVEFTDLVFATEVEAADEEEANALALTAAEAAGLSLHYMEAIISPIVEDKTAVLQGEHGMNSDLEMLLAKFQKALVDWRAAQRDYLESLIIFEAADKLRQLEEEGPEGFSIKNKAQRGGV